MKTTTISAILVMALGLMVCQVGTTKAVPMGPAFTYQGRLIDVNGPADGMHDFQFKLFDDANTVTGNQLGSTVDINDLDVIDGYFTVELDFGSRVFGGDARWLEVCVRPGDMDDPNSYTALLPRQEITPAPYALHTRGLLVNEYLGNVFAGKDAGAGNTTGFYNSAVGHDSLYSNTMGNHNSAMGHEALYSNTTGCFNSAMGQDALYSSTTGSLNSAMGQVALYSNTTGCGNSAVGSGALYSNTEGNCNSAMGGNTLLYNTTGEYNSAMGSDALLYNTIGGYNAALGGRALYLNEEGNYNSTVGAFSLYGNTTGNSNTAIGYFADALNQEGSRNTVIGCEAGGNMAAHSKSGNVLIGYRAGYYETGDNRLYIANGEADSNTLIYGEFDTGRVGIGINSPTETLDVNGTVKAVAFVGDGNGLTNLPIDSGWTISGNDMYSTVSGNVGIGTTNPQALLDVEGYSANLNLTSSSGLSPVITYDHLGSVGGGSTIGSINFKWGVSNPVAAIYAKAGSDSVNQDNAYLTLNTASEGIPIERVRIDEDGNVGIGTTSPSEKLEVTGNIKLGTSEDLYAPGTPSNSKMLRGYILGDGSSMWSEGITSQKTGTGAYSVTFDNPFSSVPTVVTTTFGGGSISSLTGFSANSFSVKTRNLSSGSLEDAPFTFIALGPR